MGAVRDAEEVPADEVARDEEVHKRKAALLLARAALLPVAVDAAEGEDAEAATPLQPLTDEIVFVL